MSSNAVICLDYDKTYDLGPEMWKAVIPAFKAAGFSVILATHRDDRYDRTPLLDDLATFIPVYYTRGVAKKWWLQQFAPAHHANVSVWIDDRPEAILNNSTMTREALVEWRKDQSEGISRPHGAYDKP